MRLSLADIPEHWLEQIAFEPNTGCWLWTGYLKRGYASAKIKGRQRFVHRVLYEKANGPIPDGLMSDHLCRTPCCVNPGHIEPVTNSVNQLRGNNVLVRNHPNLRKTHCAKGHPFSGDNLRIESSGKRRCLICLRETWKKARRTYALAHKSLKISKPR